MEFHEELKAARIKTGLTQQQIADKLGITKSTYCGYETAKRSPDPQRIKQLAKVLHVSADALLDISIEKETSPAPAKAETGEVTREMSIQLLKALGLLDKSGNLSDDDLAFLGYIVGLLEWRFGDHS
jgi:transcriptional regulator with XRE-family HTH domain|nr:MAG TPA: helix-turn-helix domain protein [Caudoviricetes sp.]